jgi:hypothetical protein
LTSEQPEVLIEGIELATRELTDADSTIDIGEEQIRVHALKRMRQSLNLMLAVIKAVAADIYAQWHPSPELPKTGKEFDPTNEAQLEDYMKQVNNFLNGLISDRDSAKSSDEAGMIQKLGKGIQKIALHVAPFVKWMIRLGKQEGVVIHGPGVHEAHGSGPCPVRSHLQRIRFTLSSRYLTELWILTIRLQRPISSVERTLNCNYEVQQNQWIGFGSSRTSHHDSF